MTANRRALLIGGAVVILAAAGGGGFAAGLAVGHSSHPSSSRPAALSATAPAPGSRRPFTGVVKTVAAGTITMTDTTSGADVTIFITPGTTIRTLTYGAERDVKPGASITVQGPRVSGDTFNARVITVNPGSPGLAGTPANSP